MQRMAKAENPVNIEMASILSGSFHWFDFLYTGEIDVFEIIKLNRGLMTDTFGKNDLGIPWARGYLQQFFCISPIHEVLAKLFCPFLGRLFILGFYLNFEGAGHGKSSLTEKFYSEFLHVRLP